jgi:predicted nucleotidyltransferase
MALATNIKDKIQRFIQLVNHDLRLEAVYLFGSSAKGNVHQWSDIDLAVVSPDFSGDSFEDSKKLIPYVLKIDTAIEVHTFRPEEFSAGNPFIDEIVGTGVRML